VRVLERTRPGASRRARDGTRRARTRVAEILAQMAGARRPTLSLKGQPRVLPDLDAAPEAPDPDAIPEEPQQPHPASMARGSSVGRSAFRRASEPVQVWCPVHAKCLTRRTQASKWELEPPIVDLGPVPSSMMTGSGAPRAPLLSGAKPHERPAAVASATG
jgi:hypothetical protein